MRCVASQPSQVSDYLVRFSSAPGSAPEYLLRFSLLTGSRSGTEPPAAAGAQANICAKDFYDILLICAKNEAIRTWDLRSIHVFLPMPVP